MYFQTEIVALCVDGRSRTNRISVLTTAVTSLPDYRRSTTIEEDSYSVQLRCELWLTTSRLLSLPYQKTKTFRPNRSVDCATFETSENQRDGYHYYEYCDIVRAYTYYYRNTINHYVYVNLLLFFSPVIVFSLIINYRWIVFEYRPESSARHCRVSTRQRKANRRRRRSSRCEGFGVSTQQHITIIIIINIISSATCLHTFLLI